MIEYATPEEILANHPEDHRWPESRTNDLVRPGHGYIADAVTLQDGITRCAAVFIGQGRSVRIDAAGTYLGDDRTDDSTHVRGGAWVSEELWLRALNRFNGESDVAL